MYLYVNVSGEGLSNVYKPPEKGNSDFYEFEYYRNVFDTSKTFKKTSVEEIGGGTWENGVTTIKYVSKNGGTITLDINGGFPVPELAYMTMDIDKFTDEIIEDIKCAFEQYHQTKFTHFEISCDGQFGRNAIYIIVRLYAGDPSMMKK